MVIEFFETGRNYVLAEIENLFTVFGMQKCCNAIFIVQNMWLEHDGENIDIDINLKKKKGGHHFRDLTSK